MVVLDSVQLAGVGLDTRCSLKHQLDAFDTLHLDLVSGLECIPFHLLQVNKTLLALVQFEFAPLHLFFYFVDLLFDIDFFD